MNATMIQVAQLILCLSILVTLHELGHFLAAKYFKTKVEKFMLFFDPWFALFKKKVGDTTYGVGWLPLGGYVKIAGMIDESMDTEQMKEPPQPWEFRSKPAWQRLIIMLAGVIVNVLLAWIIYSAILVVWGDNYISMDKMQEKGLQFSPAMKHAGFQDGDKILTVNGKVQPRADWMIIDILLADSIRVERDGKQTTISLSDGGIKAILNGAQKQGLYQPLIQEVIVDSILPGSNAYKAGLKAGDKIVEVENIPVKHFGEFRDKMDELKGKTPDMTIVRNGENIHLPVTVSDSATLGFLNKGIPESQAAGMLISDQYTLAQAIPQGWRNTFMNLSYQIKQFKLIIRPKTEAYKQVSGPLRLFKVFSPTWDWHRFWNFTAMFSVWLGFINLLPIPALDGGHALFTIIEMVTGRKMSDKTMEIAQIIGFVILMGLMLIIFGNDIFHLIKGT